MDKVAIITGSGNGIGQATAYKFAEEGAIVAVCDINSKGVAETVETILAKGQRAAGFVMDITKVDDIRKTVRKVLEDYGHIDVLVNNAGIIMDSQLKQMTDEQFDRVIEINLRGAFLLTREVVPTFISQKKGVILNTSSIVGVYGNFGQTNYAASKFGVIGFTKTWAKELGRHNIRSNAVCPGFIATSIIAPMPEKVIKAMEEKVPMKRLGKPEEIANTFAFLASDEASYINGAVIEVSGGIVI
jgi:3-oxoacyl-[acyl-carrier protein] reductase